MDATNTLIALCGNFDGRLKFAKGATSKSDLDLEA